MIKSKVVCPLLLCARIWYPVASERAAAVPAKTPVSGSSSNPVGNVGTTL